MLHAFTWNKFLKKKTFYKTFNKIKKIKIFLFRVFPSKNLNLNTMCKPPLQQQQKKKTTRDHDDNNLFKITC